MLSEAVSVGWCRMATDTAKPLRARPKILIVDDDDAFRRLMTERLSETYDVVEAANPEHALGKVLQSRPDCILLDLLMPHYSGLELCQSLGSLNFTQMIPIIVMSGQSAEVYKEFCLNLGARDFFEKPMDFPRLMVRLTEILNGPTRDRRSEPRIRMRMSLILRGFDKRGEYFEVRSTTENVSTSGFACMAAVPLEKDSMVDVELLPGAERMVGRAKIVHIEERSKGLTFYGFKVTEKYGKWAIS